MCGVWGEKWRFNILGVCKLLDRTTVYAYWLQAPTLSAAYIRAIFFSLCLEACIYHEVVYERRWKHGLFHFCKSDIKGNWLQVRAKHASGELNKCQTLQADCLDLSFYFAVANLRTIVTKLLCCFVAVAEIVTLRFVQLNLNWLLVSENVAYRLGCVFLSSFFSVLCRMEVSRRARARRSRRAPGSSECGTLSTTSILWAPWSGAALCAHAALHPICLFSFFLSFVSLASVSSGPWHCLSAVQTMKRRKALEVCCLDSRRIRPACSDRIWEKGSGWISLLAFVGRTELWDKGRQEEKKSRY